MKLQSILSKFSFQNTILNRFVKGAFWAVLGNVVIKGLSLISSVFIARILGNVDFGELAMIKTTLSVFSLVATFGLGLTVTKYIAEKKRNNLEEIPQIIAAANKITFISGIFLGSLVFILASVISRKILQSADLTTPLRIAGVYLFFNAMNVYQIGVLGGLEAFKQMFKVNIIIGLVSFPIILVTTYFGGLNGAVIGLTINLVINWYLNKKLIKKEVRKLEIKNYKKLSFVYIKNLLRFSYPIALAEGVYSLSNWALIYLLLYHTDYGEVGIFNSANQWVQMILFLPASISRVLLAFLSNQIGDTINYKKILKLNLAFNVLITLFFAVLISIFSSFIYELYGKSFEDGVEVLSILVFSTVPMSVLHILEQVCISKSKSKEILILKILRQATLLICALILFNIVKEASTLAKTWLLGYSIATVITVIYLFRKKIL